MASLQDQLLNIGAIGKKKAKKAQHQQRQNVNKNRKAVKSGKTVAADGMKQQLAQNERDKQQQDLALNKQRDAQQAEKALIAEVAQIVQHHKVDIAKDAPESYNFSHNNKVKKIYLSAEQQQQLSRGQLAIAVTGDSYALLPDKIAQKIQIRLPEMVIRIEAEKGVEDDDPYADYQIPDDLMW